MDMSARIPVQMQELDNGMKTVKVVINDESVFRFDLSVYSYAQSGDACDLYLRHLERLFHTAPSDSDILYPPPDIADMRELLGNQPIDVDTVVVSPDDIAGDLIRLLPEIKQRHRIEDRAAILVVEGDIGLLDVETAAKALEKECNNDVFQVGFYKGDISGRVWASLWWFDRSKCRGKT